MSSSMFPLPFPVHLVFSIIACAVFAFQFIRVRRAYQLVAAVAIPASLLIHVNSGKTWFYTIGILEGVLIVLAAVFMIAGSIKRKADSKNDQDDDAEEAEA